MRDLTPDLRTDTLGNYAPKEQGQSVVRSRELILKGKPYVKAEEGRYVGDRWQADKTFPTTREGDATVIVIAKPAVVRVMY